MARTKISGKAQKATQKSAMVAKSDKAKAKAKQAKKKVVEEDVEMTDVPKAVEKPSSAAKGTRRQGKRQKEGEEVTDEEVDVEKEKEKEKKLVKEEDDGKRRKSMQSSMSLRSNEIRFGEEEVVAVYSDSVDCQFVLALLLADVTIGDNAEVLVGVEWYEEDDDEKDVYFLTDTGSAETTTVDSLICAVTDKLTEMKDGSIKLRPGTNEFIAAKLAKQLEDDYDVGQESDLGDAAHARRIRSRFRRKSRSKRAKEEDDEEDEDDADEGNEDEEEGGKKKKKRKRTGTGTKSKGSKKASAVPRKSKKIAMVSPRKNVPATSDYFLTRGSKMMSFESDRIRDAKEVIRAVRAKEGKLLKLTIEDTGKVSTLLATQAPDLPFTALHYACINNDEKSVQAILQELKNPKKRIGSADLNGFQQMSTGRHSSKFSSYNRRRLNLSRGSKEGNNAFMKGSPLFKLNEINMHALFEPRKLRKTDVGVIDNYFVLFDPIDSKIFDLFTTIGDQVYEYEFIIENLVQSGSRHLAAYVIEKWGINSSFNYLHHEALSDGGGKFSKPFRTVQVLKKCQTVTRFTPVHCAAMNPDIGYLKELLAANPGAYTAQDMRRRNLLHYAAISDSDAAMRFLLNNFILDLNATDNIGLTPLLAAAQCARPACITALLETDDEELKDRMLAANMKGAGALHLAVLSHRKKNLETVKVLLEAGLSPDKQTTASKNKMTPLHYACIAGNLEIVEALVEAGGSAGLRDKLGRTTLMFAAKNGHSHVVAYLLRIGVDSDAVDTSGNTAAMYAAGYGWHECLELLIKFGEADINLANSWNATAVSLAVLKNHPKVSSMLLDLDSIDVNFVNDSGETLIMTMVKQYLETLSTLSSSMEKVEDANLLDDLPTAFTKLLGKKDIKVGLQDAIGRTELHYIADADCSSELATRKTVALSDLFIKYGASIDAADKEGALPVSLAAKQNNAALLKFFLENGADVSCKSNNQKSTLLHSIANQPTTKSIEILDLVFTSAKEASLAMCEATDEQGRTPAMCAALNAVSQGKNGMGSGIKVLKYLLRKSPNVALSPVAKKGAWKSLEMDGPPVVAGAVDEDAIRKALGGKRKIFDEYVDIDLGANTIMHCLCSKLPINELKETVKSVLDILPVGVCKSLEGLKNGNGQTLLQMLIMHRLKKSKVEDNQTEDNQTVKPRIQMNTSDSDGEDSERDSEDDDDGDDESLSDAQEDLKALQEEAEENGGFSEKNGTSGDSAKGETEKVVVDVIQLLLDKKCAKRDEVNEVIVVPFESVEQHSTYQYTNEMDTAKVAELISKAGPDTAKDFERLFQELMLARRRAVAQKNWFPTFPCFSIVGKTSTFALDFLATKMKMDMTKQAFDGSTVLHQAVGQSDLTILMYMCKSYPQLLSVPNKQQYLPLHLSVLADDAERLSTLLKFPEAQQLLEARDATGRTALMISVAFGATRKTNPLVTCESVLLEAGADVSLTDNAGWNTLHHVFMGRCIKNIYSFPQCMEKSMGDPIELISTLCNSKGGDVAPVASDKYNRTALHYAAAVNASVSCLLLMKRGTKLSQKDSDSNSPLGLAILQGHINLAIMLMKSESEANRGDLVKDHAITKVIRSSRKKLAEPIENDSCKVVETFNRDGSDYEVIEESRSTDSCFWYAASGNHQGLVYTLLDEFPYNIAIADSLQCGSFTLARKLLSTANANTIETISPSTKFSLLHQVCNTATSETEWVLELAKILVKRGVNTKAVCEQKRSALFYAAKNQHLALIKYLVEEVGLDASEKDKNGCTAAVFALSTGDLRSSETVAVLQYLLNKTKEDLSAITFQASRDKPVVLSLNKLTVKPGPNTSTIFEKIKKVREEPRETTSNATVEAVRRCASQLIERPTKQGSKNIFTLLLECKAPLDKHDGDGLSPLHHAVIEETYATAIFLLANGADPNIKSKDGSQLTPLHLAVNQLSRYPANSVESHGPMQIAELLLKFGADPAVQNADGHTALHFAVIENLTAVACLLVNSSKYVNDDRTSSSTKLSSKAKSSEGFGFVRFKGCSDWVFGQVQGDQVSFVLGENMTETSIELSLGGKTSKQRFGPPPPKEEESFLSNLWNRILDLTNTRDFGEQAGPELLSKLDEGSESALHSKLRNYSLRRSLRSILAVWLPLKATFDQVSTLDAKVVTMAKPSGMVFTPLAESQQLHIDPMQLIFQLSAENLSHLPERERAEHILRFVGMEHKIIGEENEALTKPLNVNDWVLMNQDKTWGRWTLGKVTKCNKNGSYGVELSSGKTAPTVLRIYLRPADKFGLGAIKIKEAKAKSFVSIKNKAGESALDLVIQPLSFGSFENTQIAELLINMGASPSKKFLALVRPHSDLADLLEVDSQNAMDTENDEVASIVALDKTVLEEDYKAAVLAREKETATIEVEKAPSVNPVCEVKSVGIRVLPVAKDGSSSEGYFDVVLSKVDVKVWPFGLNNFYKLQIVEDPVKKLYILINNWGRIDEYGHGKHQHTPFQTREEAVSEFEKIFRSKTGNAWSSRNAFERKPKKYKLIKSLPSEKDLPLPTLDLTHKPSTLPTSVQDAVARFTDKDELQSAVREFGLDVNTLPLGRLSMETIFEAEKELMKIKSLLDEIETVRSLTSPDIPKLLDLMDQVANHTTSFYELLPSKETDKRISPFKSTTDDKFRGAMDMVAELKDITVASQVLLASHHKRDQISSVDYCLQAVGARMEDLPETCFERRCIEQYFRNTQGGRTDIIISNVFKVDHLAGKPVSKAVDNHRLLWHGSSTANMMGILRDGLRIAPPEAPVSGSLYGKGIYCADKFEKAFSYCRADLSSSGGKQPKAYMLLVEMALGAQYKAYFPEYMEKAPNGFHSTLAVGTECPDLNKNVVLKESGITIPLGSIQQCTFDDINFTWTPLTRKASTVINKAINDPDTEFPATIENVVFENESYNAVVESPFSSVATLTKVGKGDSQDSTAQSVTVTRSGKQPSAFSDSNEFIVYDQSQARIRYVVELTNLDWVKRQASKKNEQKGN